MPPGFINEMRPGGRVIAMFRAGASLQRSVWLHGAPSVEELRKAGCIARAERDGTRAETRFRLSQKRTSRFKSVGASVQSTAGSRGVRTSLSNAG